MTHDHRRNSQDRAGDRTTAGSPASVPGKRTLVEDMFERDATAPVQRKAAGPSSEGHVHDAAQRGIAGSGSRLPHLDVIQRSFGAHDVSNVQAHTGEGAARASSEIGAQAFATGNHVAFAGTPDLHTAAHEAAHVVQQRAGVHLSGGVGQAGDPYERHADAVADVVVAGGSAAALLSQMAPSSASLSSGGAPAIQRDGPGDAIDPEDDHTQVPAEYKALNADIINLLDRSRLTMGLFKGQKFWPAMRELGVANLHTLVQIHKHAKPAGVWSVINQLKSIYTYGTSWGVYYMSSDNPAGLMDHTHWGKDAPQKTTADEHPNGDKYTWYRQNTGIGHPGLHMGVGKSGAEHDLHVDGNNPMKAVSKGEWAMLPTPMYKEPGEAIYGAGAIVHAAEIKAGFESENAAGTRSFLGASDLEESRKHAQGYIDREREVQPYTKDLQRSEQCIGWIVAVNARITTYLTEARQLAMGDDSDPRRQGLDVNVKHTKRELLVLLTSLFAHMKSETPEVDVKGFDQRDTWDAGTWQAYDTSVKLVEARKKKGKAG